MAALLADAVAPQHVAAVVEERRIVERDHLRRHRGDIRIAQPPKSPLQPVRRRGRRRCSRAPRRPRRPPRSPGWPPRRSRCCARALDGTSARSPEPLGGAVGRCVVDDETRRAGGSARAPRPGSRAASPGRPGRDDDGGAHADRTSGRRARCGCERAAGVAGTRSGRARRSASSTTAANAPEARDVEAAAFATQAAGRRRERRTRGRPRRATPGRARRRTRRSPPRRASRARRRRAARSPDGRRPAPRPRRSRTPRSR